MEEKLIHQGRNIKRFREMQGIKQEAFASLLGNGWSQRKVSALENKEVIDLKTLKLVAPILHVSIEAIQTFDESTGFNIFSNTYNENSASIQYNFNPIDKLVFALEENKKLYERLLKSEREKNDLLQKILNKLK